MVALESGFCLEAVGVVATLFLTISSVELFLSSDEVEPTEVRWENWEVNPKQAILDEIKFGLTN